MAKQLKLRRGTTSQHSSFTGAEGEVTVDTTKDTVVVHDGSTAGGIPLAKESAAYTHPNHSGEVTSSADGAQTIASNVVDEDNLKISNSGSNGQFLQKQSGNTGGLTWATVPSTSTGGSNTQIQYNNSGSFAGLSSLTTDGTDVTFVGDVGSSTPADANMTWDRSTDKLKFGKYCALDFHNGNTTFNDNGGYSWWINHSSNGTMNINAASRKGIMVDGSDNTSVSLYQGDSLKLKTTSSGVTITGTATATTFSGSGASLTNLPAANLTGTLPSLNGGNLTNLSAGNLTGSFQAIPAGNLTDLNASNLGSGIVPTARLGSGTANSSKVLYGNNTWGDPPAASSLVAGDGQQSGTNNANRITLGTGSDFTMAWNGYNLMMEYGRDTANYDDSGFYLQNKSSNHAGYVWSINNGYHKLRWWYQDYNNSTGRWEDESAVQIGGPQYTSAPNNKLNKYAMTVYAPIQVGDWRDNMFIGLSAGKNTVYQQNTYTMRLTYPKSAQCTYLGQSAGEWTAWPGSGSEPWGQTAVGARALKSNTTGSYNTAIGSESMTYGTTHNHGCCVGINAGAYITTGHYNVAIGSSAMSGGSWKTGSKNIAIGYEALRSLSSGENNIAIGWRTGYYNSPGGEITTSSNNLILGNTSTQSFYCSDTSISSSDKRDKTDVTDFTHGLKWVEQLKPVTYRWDKRDWYKKKNDDGSWTDSTPDGSKKRARQHIGFLAQDVLAIEQADGFASKKDDMLVVNLNEDDTAYGLKYERLVPVLVNAIKELSAKVKALEAK